MNIIQSVKKTIEDILQPDPNVNKITFGDIDFIALEKTTNYPLVHFDITSVDVLDYTYNIGIQMFAFDVLDESPESDLDRANETSVRNDQLAVIVRLMSELKRGDITDGTMHLITDPSIALFTERFKDRVSGAEVEFTVEIPTKYNYCTIE